MSDQQVDPTKKISAIERAAPPTAPRYDWNAIAEQLRADPLEWYKVFEQGRISLVNAVRQGSVAPVHPDLGFETTTRNNHRVAPRVADLYMRFNPEKVNILRSVLHSQRKA